MWSELEPESEPHHFSMLEPHQNNVDLDPAPTPAGTPEPAPENK
jgi:hypothetical protein